MEYGLLPTETAIAFIVILMLVYYKKQQFEGHKTKIYKDFLISSLLYCCFLFATKLLIKYVGDNIISLILWRMTLGCMIVTWVNYFLYGFVTVYNIPKEAKVATYSIETKMLYGLKVFAVLVMIFPLKTKFLDFPLFDHGAYHSQATSIAMAVITVFGAIIYIFRMKKFDDKISTEYKFGNAIALISSLIIWCIHIFVYELSYVPLGFAFITYIIYFVQENPDIILLKEIKEIEEKNKDEQTNSKFLGNLNSNTKESVHKMLELCNEVKNNETNDYNLVKSKIKEINNLGKEVLETLDDVFDASQIKTTNAVVEDRRYDIKELVNNLTNIAQEKLSGKKVKLVVNVDSNMSSKYYGDYEKISSTLNNIISVSASNTRLGRLTISISSTKNNGNETILFKIIDTGEGLKKEEQEMVFNESSDKFPGLLVAKKNIEVMGGKIWFESRYKLGTKFYVELEQKIADATQLGNLADLNQEVNIDLSNVDRSKYKILIVDDCISNTRLTKKLLTDRNFQVEVITSGQECVTKIKAEEKIDGIFMDIMMADMNGIETLEVLKQLEGYTLPPIIALTANALSGMREKYLSAGFDDYIAKPVDIKELDKVLNKYFNK